MADDHDTVSEPHTVIDFGKWQEYDEPAIELGSFLRHLCHFTAADESSAWDDVIQVELINSKKLVIAPAGISWDTFGGIPYGVRRTEVARWRKITIT